MITISGVLMTAIWSTMDGKSGLPGWRWVSVKISAETSVIGEAYEYISPLSLTA
jgi:hypothetical protein